MIISAKVKPNSIEDKVEKISEGKYIICVREKAVDGKANLAVRKLLAKEFKVSAFDVKIKTPKSREKIIETSRFVFAQLL